MAEPKKVKDFFKGRRRKAVLVQYTHLKTKKEENRYKLSLSLPLFGNGESLVSMPKAVSEVFNMMAKDDSEASRTNVNVIYDGMTFEMFNQDKGGSPAHSSTSVTFQDLHLICGGKGEKKTIDLKMTAYIPGNPQLRDWLYPQLHKPFFCEATYSQTEIDFGETRDEDEDLADGAPVDPPPIKSGNASGKPAAAAKKASKSGPKDLALFHANQKPN